MEYGVVLSNSIRISRISPDFGQTEDIPLLMVIGVVAVPMTSVVRCLSAVSPTPNRNCYEKDCIYTDGFADGRGLPPCAGSLYSQCV